MGDVPPGWIATTIGDQVALQRGIDITRASQRPGTVPVVSSGGISSWHDTAMVSGPGVVLGRKGTLGKTYFVPSDFWPHDTTLWVRDFKGNDARFVYYFFLGLDFRHLDVGSANPTLNRNHVHPIPAVWPPLPEQRAIAEVLGALDDKIEANRRVEVAIWSLAKAQFDVLAAEPDEFVPLGSVLSLAYGKSLTAELRLPGTTPVYGSGGVIGWHNTPLASGPGVIVGRKGTAGAVHWCQTDFFAIDTTFYVEKPAVPMLFAYFLLRSLGLAHMNSDSAVPGLNRNAALRRLVPLPDGKSLAEFSWSAEPLIKAAGSTQREGRILTDLRDTLLPKLLSGALRVRAAEELVAGAV